jgi:Chaperone of endosialidase
LYSLLSLTDGSFNTAVGAGTLLANTANSNTATGAGALLNNTEGFGNTANGTFALFSNTTGGGHTALGYGALSTNTNGANNTALGSFAGQGVTTASNVICIRSLGANVNNSCFIGNICGATTVQPDAIPVLIDSAGQLGTVSSSRRYKKEITPMKEASEAILALKPVTFHYKSDNTSRPEFGLIAEEVAEVNPDLVVRDANGEIYTVRYDAVNAMLLNEFLKEHSTVEELKKEIATLTATVNEQAAQIQKVSAQLEASKPAPQVVNNP